MVKGTTRRVVVVKPPGKGIFEEALFFLRLDGGAGITGDDIVAEAQSIADSFAHIAPREPLLQRLRTAGLVALGAAVSSIVWVICTLIAK